MELELKTGDTPDLLEMFNFFEENYHGKLATLTTPYKPLGCFYIPFSNDNFPHLLGLHKVNNSRAKQIIEKIKKEEITYETIQSHTNFNSIKDRITYFNFIDKVFLYEEIKECIHVSEMDSRNRMRLDIVFIEEGIDKILTLGFRESQRTKDFYMPTTFYVNRNKDNYNHSKRIEISNIKWD